MRTVDQGALNISLYVYTDFDRSVALKLDIGSRSAGPGIMSVQLRFPSPSGFLNSAKALDPVLSQRINHYLERRAGSVNHILFARHSAGGAVASLLYLRHLPLQGCDDK